MHNQICDHKRRLYVRKSQKSNRYNRNETALPPHLDSVHISTRPFRSKKTYKLLLAETTIKLELENESDSENITCSRLTSVKSGFELKQSDDRQENHIERECDGIPISVESKNNTESQQGQLNQTSQKEEDALMDNTNNNINNKKISHIINDNNKNNIKSKNSAQDEKKFVPTECADLSCVVAETLEQTNKKLFNPEPVCDPGYKCMCMQQQQHAPPHHYGGCSYHLPYVNNHHFAYTKRYSDEVSKRPLPHPTAEETCETFDHEFGSNDKHTWDVQSNQDPQLVNVQEPMDSKGEFGTHAKNLSSIPVSRDSLIMAKRPHFHKFIPCSNHVCGYSQMYAAMAPYIPCPDGFDSFKFPVHVPAPMSLGKRKFTKDFSESSYSVTDSHHSLINPVPVNPNMILDPRYCAPNLPFHENQSKLTILHNSSRNNNAKSFDHSTHKFTYPATIPELPNPPNSNVPNITKSPVVTRRNFQTESHLISLNPISQDNSKIAYVESSHNLPTKLTSPVCNHQSKPLTVKKLHHLPQLHQQPTDNHSRDLCVKCNKCISNPKDPSAEKLVVVEYSTFSDNDQFPKSRINTQSTVDSTITYDPSKQSDNFSRDTFDEVSNDNKVIHYMPKNLHQKNHAENLISYSNSLNSRDDRKRLKPEDNRLMHVYGVSQPIPKDEEFLINRSTPQISDQPQLVIMCQVPATGAALLKKPSPLRNPSTHHLIPRKLPKNPSTGFLKDEPHHIKHPPPEAQVNFEKRFANPEVKQVVQEQFENITISVVPPEPFQYSTPKRTSIRRSSMEVPEIELPTDAENLPDYFPVLQTIMYQAFSQVPVIDYTVVNTRTCHWIWEILQNPSLWQAASHKIRTMDTNKVFVWLTGGRPDFLAHNATYLISCFLLEAASLFEKALMAEINNICTTPSRELLRERMSMEQRIITIFVKEVFKRWIQAIRTHVSNSETSKPDISVVSHFQKLLDEQKTSITFLKELYEQVTTMSTVYLSENPSQKEESELDITEFSTDLLIKAVEDEKKNIENTTAEAAAEKEAGDSNCENTSEESRLILEQRLVCFAIFNLERNHQLNLREELRQRFCTLEESKRRWIKLLSFYTKQSVQKFAETRQKQRQYLHNLIHTDHISAQSQTLLFCPKCYFPVPSASFNHPKVTTDRRTSVFKASKRLSMRMSIDGGWAGSIESESMFTCFCPHCGNHFDIPLQTSDLLNVMPSKDVRRRSTVNPFASATRKSLDIAEKSPEQENNRIEEITTEPENPAIEKPTCWNQSKKQLLSNLQHSAAARRVGVLGLLSLSTEDEYLMNQKTSDSDKQKTETANNDNPEITTQSPKPLKRESVNVLDTVDQLLTTPTDRSVSAISRFEETEEALPEPLKSLSSSDWLKQRRRKTWSFTTRLKGKPVPAVS